MKFIDPATFKLQLKGDQEEEEKKDNTASKKSIGATSKEAGGAASKEAEGEDCEKDEELEQIKQHEKTVNIRFGNYSMLMRAS